MNPSTAGQDTATTRTGVAARGKLFRWRRVGVRLAATVDSKERKFPQGPTHTEGLRPSMLYRRYRSTGRMATGGLLADGHHSAWEKFCNAKLLQRVHQVTPREMNMLSQVALLGELKSTRDYLFVLTTIRGALVPKEETPVEARANPTDPS